jgi:hypothetical protein
LIPPNSPDFWPNSTAPSNWLTLANWEVETGPDVTLRHGVKRNNGCLPRFLRLHTVFCFEVYRRFLGLVKTSVVKPNYMALDENRFVVYASKLSPGLFEQEQH